VGALLALLAFLPSEFFFFFTQNKGGGEGGAPGPRHPCMFKEKGENMQIPVKYLYSFKF